MECDGCRLCEGETVVFIDRKQREYVAQLRTGQDTNIRGGRIAHTGIIGGLVGVRATSSTGERFMVLRPTLAQFIMNMPRTGQIIYPKDIAIILLWADVFPGARVVEGGIGSGAMAMALVRAVTSSGRVFSYETREDVMRRAEKNITQFLGVSSALELRLGDIYAGIQETEIDRVILDVPEPWDVVTHASAALKPGGLLVSYVPTIIQVRHLVDTLQHTSSFCCEQAIEVLVRPWNVEGMSVRPVHRMVAHTGFIVSARCQGLST